MPKTAKKRSRRRSANFGVLPFDETLVLSTLADNAITTAALQVLTQDFDVRSIDALCTIDGVTLGDGPLQVGWAQSNLIGAEIVEYLDAAPTSQTDVPAIEHAKRRVRSLGAFRGSAGSETLNDGKPIRSRMFIRVPDGDAVADMWLVNRSGAALQTGAIVHFQGKIYGHWK